MSTPTTRCKFKCNEVSHQLGGYTKVTLGAVYPNPATDGYSHDEDHAFFNATPSGTLVMTIQNPYGAELFQAGKDFYLDISEAAPIEAAS